MKARLLLLLSSLILAATPAAAQRKAIMEGLAASNNAIFIDTTTVKVTVGTGGVCFQDATCQTTSASTSSIVVSSTFTYLPGGITTQGSLGVCFANSTVTMTTENFPLEIIFSGSVSNNSTQESAMSFLVDGAFIAPLTATIAVITPSPLSTQCQNASFKYQIPSQGAGSHSVCLTAATNSGVNLTITGRSTKCPYQSTWNTASQFGFKEVR